MNVRKCGSFVLSLLGVGGGEESTTRLCGDRNKHLFKVGNEHCSGQHAK